MSARTPVEKIRAVRDFTGLGIGEIQAGMRAMSTDDPLVGAGYSIAHSHAVVIHGDRYERDRSFAEAYAAKHKGVLGGDDE